MANEIRKTSMGMQAVGTRPLSTYDDPTRRPARADGRMHAFGLGVTVALHAVVVLVVLAMNAAEEHRVKNLPEPPYQAIEAGLAIKKKSTEGKSKLPQKDVTQKVKPPDAPMISSNPDVVPDTTKKDKKPPPPPDAVDSKSVFDKYRKMDTGAAAGDKSTDESNKQGSEDGSEFGTLERAKGDPYVGELIGRMTTDFAVPSLVSDATLKTWGCVKLDENGKILDRAIDPEHKSGSHAFNSAVENRLKLTTDMDKPVPNYLKTMLVGKFVCATYTSKVE